MKSSVSDESAIPDDYAWPGGEAIAASTEPLFWISPDPKRSATPLFMVCGTDDRFGGGGISIIAEKCYLRWAIRIVDGLRITETQIDKTDKTGHLFVKFTEENEHEGETWHHWLQVDGNEDELAKLAGKLALLVGDAESDFTKPYTLVSDYMHESGVDLLVRHADDLGYMPIHQKVTGKFTCPDDLDQYGDELYKGGIKKFFTEETQS